jgi:hypothetical protein
MTTTVTVKTCAWPVKVIGYPCADGQPINGSAWQELGRLDPHSERDFYVHSGMDVCVQELPLPATDAG